MGKDPIVEEIHRIREEHAARFDYDIGAIVRDLQESERKSGRVLIHGERSIPRTGDLARIETQDLPQKPQEASAG